MAPVQKLVTTSAVAASLLWGSTAFGYALVILNPDKDTTIFSEDGDRDNGGGASLYAGVNSSNQRRFLVHFDISSIPGGSNIQYVYLYFYQRGIPAPASPAAPAADTMYAHRILSFWYEGAQSMGDGNPQEGCSSTCTYPVATYPSPTWTWEYYGSTTWTAGSPVYGSASANYAEDTTTGYKLFNDQTPTIGVAGAGLRNDVQGWLNGSFGNYGWMVYAYPGNAYSARYFDSREAGNGTPPELYVYYYKPLGAGCSSSSECSGYCTNGVCCNVASCPAAPDCQNSPSCARGGGVCSTLNNGAGTACSSPDTNPCTADQCDGSGSCIHPAGNAGAACGPDDGNPCTLNVCNGSSTTCTYPAGNAGAACPDDLNPCTFDQCDGSSTACQHPANNSGTCTDGNACTTDTCSGGACVSSAPKSCPAIDECHTAGTCNPADGTCSTPAKPDGTACSADANPCTADICSGGACTHPAGNAGATCADDGNPCTTDLCNGSSTTCQHAAGNAGAQCSGPSCSCPPTGDCIAKLASTCTGSSATCPAPGTVDCAGALCSGSVCAGGCAVDTDCTTGNFCLGGKCTPKRANGDPKGCAANDYCTSGNCVDGYCCNTACAGGTGDCQACNVAGKLGTCSPVPANTQCRAQSGECDATDFCDGTSTTCADSKQPNGTACTDDGLICTTDTCQSGTCTHTAGNAGTVCRATAGTCDVAEKCTGTSPACPADGFIAATGRCRVASCTGGVQTLQTFCSGTGPTCAPAVTKACAPYVCGATACLTSCSTDTDCSVGNWCSNGVCIAKVPNGSTCTAGNSCVSGICADGVCCNAACTGECEACDVAAAVGTCSPVTGKPHGSRTQCATDSSLCGGACNGTNRTACTYPGSSTQCRAPSCGAGTATLGAVCNGAGSCPTLQTQDCGQYVCGATACLGNCNTDLDCVQGDYCSAKVCKPRVAAGQACSSNDQCTTGHCVDKVCCDQACGAECEACDVAGSVGKCSPVTGKPHGGRAPCASDGTVCGGQCDGTQVTACAYPGDGVVCHDAACVADNATLVSYCNGAGSCPPVQQQACGPQFKCDSTGTRCNGNCTVDSDCGFQQFCSAGVCAPLLGNGKACGAPTQCASSYCVDGVCCDSSCSGQCEACNLTGSEGTCTPVTGAPTGIRPPCASDGSVCAGTCNGVNTDQCTYPDKGKNCRAGSCAAGVATLAAACSGDGRCPLEILQSCGTNACSGSICGGGCTADIDCPSTEFCAGGVCIAKLGIGKVCSADSQCSGGHCVDGFCCDSACTGQCQACDVIGFNGTCTTVPAGQEPHGGRVPCAGVSACAATCDGKNATACAFPGRSKACGLAFCRDGVATAASACNGAGTCLATSSTPCDPYVCDTSGGTQACLTSCTTSNDCAAAFGCVNGQCLFGAPRDAGSTDATTDAVVPSDAANDGETGSAAGGTAGAGGAGGKPGTGGKGGRGGTAGTGGAPVASDSGADSGPISADAGPDAGTGHKGKKAGAAAADQGGCGCRVGAQSESSGAAWPLAGLLVLGLRRWRRRNSGARA